MYLIQEIIHFWSFPRLFLCFRAVEKHIVSNKKSLCGLPMEAFQAASLFNFVHNKMLLLRLTGVGPVMLPPRKRKLSKGRQTDKWNYIVKCK